MTDPHVAPVRFYEVEHRGGAPQLAGGSPRARQHRYVFQYSSRVLVKTCQHFRTPDEAARWHTGPFGRFQFCVTLRSAMTDRERMTGRATRLRGRPQRSGRHL
eukprot:979636-Prymnesium_polylepis.3